MSQQSVPQKSTLDEKKSVSTKLTPRESEILEWVEIRLEKTDSRFHPGGKPSRNEFLPFLNLYSFSGMPIQEIILTLIKATNLDMQSLKNTYPRIHFYICNPREFFMGVESCFMENESCLLNVLSKKNELIHYKELNWEHIILKYLNANSISQIFDALIAGGIRVNATTLINFVGFVGSNKIIPKLFEHKLVTKDTLNHVIPTRLISIAEIYCYQENLVGLILGHQPVRETKEFKGLFKSLLTKSDELLQKAKKENKLPQGNNYPDTAHLILQDPDVCQYLERPEIYNAAFKTEARARALLNNNKAMDILKFTASEMEKLGDAWPALRHLIIKQEDKLSASCIQRWVKDKTNYSDKNKTEELLLEKLDKNVTLVDPITKNILKEAKKRNVHQQENRGINGELLDVLLAEIKDHKQGIRDYEQGILPSDKKALAAIIDGFDFDNTIDCLTKEGEKEFMVYILDECYKAPNDSYFSSGFISKFKEKASQYPALQGILTEINTVLKNAFDFDTSKNTYTIKNTVKGVINANKQTSPGSVLYAQYKTQKESIPVSMPAHIIGGKPKRKPGFKPPVAPDFKENKDEIKDSSSTSLLTDSYSSPASVYFNNQTIPLPPPSAPSMVDVEEKKEGKNSLGKNDRNNDPDIQIEGQEGQISLRESDPSLHEQVIIIDPNNGPDLQIEGQEGEESEDMYEPGAPSHSPPPYSPESNFIGNSFLLTNHETKLQPSGANMHGMWHHTPKQENKQSTQIYPLKLLYDDDRNIEGCLKIDQTGQRHYIEPKDFYTLYKDLLSGRENINNFKPTDQLKFNKIVEERGFKQELEKELAILTAKLSSSSLLPAKYNT